MENDKAADQNYVKSSISSSGNAAINGLNLLSSSELRRWELELAVPIAVSNLVKKYGFKTVTKISNTPGFEGVKDYLRSTLSLQTVERDYYSELGIGKEGEIIVTPENEKTEAVRVLNDLERKEEYDKKMEESNGILIEQAKLPSFRLLALGGGDEIGRSCYYVKVGTHHVLLDSGVKQQSGWNNNLNPRFDLLASLPPVEAVFISHAHTDHIGGLTGLIDLIPESVPIFMTPGTKQYYFNDLDDLIRKGETLDPVKISSRITTVDVGARGEVNGLKYYLPNAGHIEGSVMTFLEAKDGDSVLYTGDVNFEETEMQVPAKPVKEHVGTLITEATYGGVNERRGSRIERTHDIKEITASGLKEGKKILIAVFAKGRTEEVISILDRGMEEGSIPIAKAYVTGLGAKNSEDFGFSKSWKHFEILGKKRQVQKKRRNGTIETVEVRPDPAMLDQYMKGLLHGTEPVIIVTGSGFLDRGESSQLMVDASNIKDCSIYITGYTPPNSTGSLLLKAVNGEKVGLDVVAEVRKVQLSAHASEEALIDFIQEQKPNYVIVVHSERGRVERFVDAVRKLKIYILPSQNLRVMYNYPHTGFQYLPAEGEKERQEILCRCGRIFVSVNSARAHAEREGHRLIDWYAYYKFQVMGYGFEPKDIKGAFYAHVDREKIKEVRFAPQTSVLIVKGRLVKEDISQIERKVRRAGGEEVALHYMNTDFAYRSSPIDKPQLVLQDLMIPFRGTTLTSPYLKIGDMPVGISGYYDPLRRMIVLPLKRMNDEEDARLVITHEFAHHVQFSKNKFVMEIASGSFGQPSESYFEFAEGFASYYAEKLGHSKRLINIYHEIGTPKYYWNGRMMFNAIERAYGEEKTFKIAYNETPAGFKTEYEKAMNGTEMGRKSKVDSIIEILKINGLWKKKWIISQGFPKEVLIDMRESVLANFKVVRSEFEGWPLDLIREEVLTLTVADFLISRSVLGPKPSREDVKEVLMVLFEKKYRKFYEELRNGAYQSYREEVPTGSNIEEVTKVLQITSGEGKAE